MRQTELARRLDEAVRTHWLVGVSAALVVEGATVSSAAAGRADLRSGASMSAEAACNWFSMTKIATATAAMVLSDQGQLDLNAPVGEYLGDLWPSRFAAVRVRHLLSHSSGLRNPLPIRWVHAAGKPRPDPRAWLARLLAKQRRLRFEPGSRASYTNVGYLAIGEVIASASGRTYEDFVVHQLLQPLGMHRTGFTWNDVPKDTPRATGHQRARRPLAFALRRFVPDDLVDSRHDRFVDLRPFELDGAAYGGLIGPVTDAARLLALHCNHGTLDGVSLLSAHSVEQMATIIARGRPYDVGLGWFKPTRDEGPRVQHFGGGMGFWNVLRYDPRNGHAIAIMSNVTQHWDITALADAALDHDT